MYDEIYGDGFKVERGFVFDFCIDWDEKVFCIDLYVVIGVE